MISRTQDSLAQDSLTNDLYFYTRDFSRIFFTFCVKYGIVSSKMYIHISILFGVNSWAQDSLAQDSMTNDLCFYTRDFSRIFFTYCVKYEAVSTNMLYISCVNRVFWPSRAIQCIKSVSRNRLSLSLRIKDPGPWSSQYICIVSDRV